MPTPKEHTQKETRLGGRESWMVQFGTQKAHLEEITGARPPGSSAAWLEQSDSPALLPRGPGQPLRTQAALLFPFLGISLTISRSQ